MPTIIEFVTFKLKEGVSEQLLLPASDDFNTGFLSLQKGYVDRKLIRNGDTWADVVLWETMEDAMNAVKAFEQCAAEQHTAVLAYGTLIDEDNCAMKHFNIVKGY